MCCHDDWCLLSGCSLDDWGDQRWVSRLCCLCKVLINHLSIIYRLKRCSCWSKIILFIIDSCLVQTLKEGFQTSMCHKKYIYTNIYIFRYIYISLDNIYIFGYIYELNCILSNRFLSPSLCTPVACGPYESGLVSRWIWRAGDEQLVLSSGTPL